MSDAAFDDDEAMLVRLAQRDLSAAERVHDKLMAAEEAAEIADLGRTYQRLSRCVRQTLALKARLKRDRDRKPAETVAPARPGAAAVARRIRELRQGVARIAWNEAPDRETYDWYIEEVACMISEEMRQDDFASEPLDDHIARVALALGLPAETIEHWRELPDPGDGEPPNPESG